MLPGWFAIFLFLAYMALLFVLARWGERAMPRLQAHAGTRKAIYSLSACVFTSSWSYFGSIGLASRQGIAYLPMFIGPMLAFAFLFPLIARMVRLTKAQNITSLADFVAARYGRSGAVAATVTGIVTLAYLPYIALQLRAVALSMAIFLDGHLPEPGDLGGTATTIILIEAVVLAAFSIAVGARRLDATQHLRGLMLVIAAESIVKLIALLVIGVFVTWGLFGGLGDLVARVEANATIAQAIQAPLGMAPLDIANAVSMIALTTAVALFIPHQFHVTVVENRDETDVRTAAWLVPLYLTATNLFVIPIAAAGLLTFSSGTLDRDLTILALPIHAHAPGVTTLTMIGGFSAATSMIFVTATVLATMIANNLVLPVVLRLQGRVAEAIPSRAPILAIRRLAIAAIFALSSLFAVWHIALPFSSIGLIALIGLVQIVPATLGGLFWWRATGRGAIGGSLAGVAVTVYTLVLPAILPRSASVLASGPFGIDALRPTDLFGLDLAPFLQALVWSLAANIVVYVLLSVSRSPTILERMQATVFLLNKPPGPASSSYARHFGLSTGDLLAGVETYVGPTTEARFRAHQAADGIAFDPNQQADASLTAFAETLLTSTIGTASAHLVIALLRRREVSREAALRIANDLAFEIQDGRDVLQHAIDVARDGMAVFDADLRLVAWNRTYRDMFDLPEALMRVGVTLERLIRSNAERGLYGEGPVEPFIAARFDVLARGTNETRLRSSPLGRVLEMRSIRLYNGGIFFTYTDATERAKTEEELAAENEWLERRVNERTEELQHLNFELARAKAEADDANISKTRFLAAASHDLLQPLNAARLYTTSLRERLRDGATVADNAGISGIAANVDASLEAVEEILGALLEISQLDAGATEMEITDFAIGGILRQLKMEFGPVAFENGLRLTVMPSTLYVRSDRRLLRRLLQNLISNAIKYTTEGRVLIGVRRVGASVRLDVADSGMGVPKSQQQAIFREFTRLPDAVKAAPGVGLGLSIVERLGRVLGHELNLRSEPGRGSVFSVTVPLASAPADTGMGLLGPATPARQRSLDGLKVAAIDDEAHILAGMEVLLRGWDCVVAKGTGLVEIETALAAVDMRPDVIIADFHIGDTDGIAVIQALRQRHGPCPAVLITADRAATVKSRAFTEDVRVLYKPVKPAALRSLLSQWRLVKSPVD